jgi:DNA-binding HxlR family transcriptional regulator
VRSYGQICGIAKGLELIGDRWTLLIVRELLIRGRCRYTDLRNGLPGIATNLLAERLRELEQTGIVYSEQAPPPVATTLFGLTERGEALEPVIDAIAAWGRPLLSEAKDDESFQIHWLILPLRMDFEDAAPEEPPVQIQLDVADDPVVVETTDGAINAYVGRARSPDLMVRGPGRPIAQLIAGRTGPAEARKRGVELIGDSKLLRRLRARQPLV